MLVCYIGPAEEEQKVYLSPATLLVLPPTLIPHWLHQIRVHMKPNTLRVAVLATDRGSADDASIGLHAIGLHAIGLHAIGLHAIGLHAIGLHAIGLHAVKHSFRILSMLCMQ